MEHNIVKSRALHYIDAKIAILSEIKRNPQIGITKLISRFKLTSDELIGIHREIRAYKYLRAKYKEPKWTIEWDRAQDLKGVDFTVLCDEITSKKFGQTFYFAVSGVHDKDVQNNVNVDYYLIVSDTTIYQKKVNHGKK